MPTDTAPTTTTHLAAARVTLGLYATAASVYLGYDVPSDRGNSLCCAVWNAARIIQDADQGRELDPDALMEMYGALEHL